MSTWNRLRLVPAVLVTALLMALSPEDAELEIENLKGEVMNDDAMVKMAEEWCPEVVEPLVFERDLFLTESIRITAMHCNRVLAVVGSGHGPGIKRAWAALRQVQPESAESTALEGEVLQLLAYTIDGVLHGTAERKAGERR